MSIIREERIGDCRLILGDSVEVMQHLGPVDAIITDPVWPNCPAELIAGSEDPWGLWQDACAAMPHARRHVIVMRHDCDPRFLAPVPGAFFRTQILPYVMPSYIGRSLGGDEIAYCFGEPIPRRRGQIVIPGRGPAVQPVGRRANGHPCSRPQAHFDWLIRWHSEPGETVLDPFMGSGTTLVACAKLGRAGIGIEIDAAHFELACARVADAYRQPDLLVLPMAEARAEQLGMFSRPTTDNGRGGE